MIIKRMFNRQDNRILRYAYSGVLSARKTRKKIWNNYYLKNWMECRSTKKSLDVARASVNEREGDKNPLVSVCIPTYNRGEILTKRTIPSVLKQTYQNFEIVVVGDNCTDDTEISIKKLSDDRIKFYNLPERGKYPEDPYKRWMVAGTVPANKAIELSTGAWIAPLDDDDEFSEDHLETLLNFALEHNYEMVYGVVRMEVRPDEWINLGSYPLKEGHISHLTVLYQSKLNFFRYDINAWKYEEPADWNMWRRMNEAGVKIGFIDKVVGTHYLEKTTIPPKSRYRWRI